MMTLLALIWRQIVLYTNKSNLTAGALQVEANLQKEQCSFALYKTKMLLQTPGTCTCETNSDTTET